MPVVETCETHDIRQVWTNWVSLQEMGLEHRTGRLLGWYAGRQHVALDIQDGAIATVEASDRELRIEQVVLRMGLVAPERLRLGLREIALRKGKGNCSIVPYLLRTRMLDRRTAAMARERQMVAIMHTLLTASDVTLTFIDQPSVLPSVETAIRISEALATAFAEEPILRARCSALRRPRNVSLLVSPLRSLPQPESKAAPGRRRTV